jgi:hypothetical protein
MGDNVATESLGARKLRLGGQVRELSGPGAAGLKDLCSRTFAISWGDKKPRSVGAMLAGHFPPRADDGHPVFSASYTLDSNRP